MNDSDRQHDAEEFERLVRFMTRKGRRFGLALATYADVELARAQRELAIERASAAGLKVGSITLADAGEDIVASLVERSADKDILFVVGLDPIAYDVDGRDPETVAITNLNLRRDELPELLNARLVFWIIAEGYPQLARIAWDLLDVMLIHFEFHGENARAPTDVALPTRHPKWMQLSPGVEIRQIALQAQNLADTARKTNDESTAADAAASAGQLYATLGQFDEAFALLDIAASNYERLGERGQNPKQFLAAAIQRQRLAELARQSGANERAVQESLAGLDLIERGSTDLGSHARLDVARARIELLENLAMLAPEPPRPIESDDWDLFRRWHEGDRKSADALFFRHFTRTRQFFILLAPDFSEDLVQETFIHLANTRLAAQPNISFPIFLWKTAHKVLSNHFRALHRNSNATSAPGSIHVDRFLDRRVLEALDQLPVDDQALIELHFIEHLTPSELAEVFELPEATLRLRIDKARRRLLEEYQAQQGSADGSPPLAAGSLEHLLESLRPLPT